MVRLSEKLTGIANYPFAEIDKKIQDLHLQGVDVIDMGVGDPITFEVPQVVRNATIEYIQENPMAGYPSYEGAPWYRQAVAQWFRKRFGVELDPETEVTATIGSKEAIFNFHHALIDPKDIVLCPTPGYPPYHRGAVFAGGEVVFYPVAKENGFFPDFSQIPVSLLNRAKLLWLNHPHSPTGRVLTIGELRQIYTFAQKWGLIIASDEAYSELWYGTPPHSMLEVSKKGVIVFQSLSKRSAMTGYRIGFAAGDPELIAALRKVKTNIDSGAPNFVQAAAVAALQDESHVQAMRKEYLKRIQVLVDMFISLDFPVRRPEATIYLWQEIPKSLGVNAFMKKLLHPDVGVVAIPGYMLSEELVDGTNPGKDFVRFSVKKKKKKTKEAAKRIYAALQRL